MKQSIILSLSFYLYMAMYFIGNNMYAQNCYRDTVHQKDSRDLIIANMYTTLRVVKKIHRDIENQYNELSGEEEKSQQDCMVDVMVILVGTYEKIVGATVTYYLMMHTPNQKDLQTAVALIIAEDVIKILNILGKRFLSFIFNEKLSWQKKAWYCSCIATAIIAVKIGVDKIPQSIKTDPKKDDLATELEENNDVFNEKIAEKSACLEGKYNNWK